MPRRDNQYVIACHRLSRLFPKMSEMFTHFALHVAKRNSTVKQTALYRMFSLHKGCSRIHLQAGVAAAASLYIQAHIAAAESNTTVCELYRQNKNPEQWYKQAHVCYPFTKNQKLAEKANTE